MCGNVHLQYTILEFLPHTEPAPTPTDQVDDFGLSPINTIIKGRDENLPDWGIPPEGIFCQRPESYRRKLPEIPDQFSVNIETLDEV